MTKADCDTLQSDLNALSAWSKLWLLEFNAEKCVVLRIRAAITYQYSLNTVYLQKVASQKDLGITVSNNLTPTLHIRDIIKKAHRKIAMFRRCFTGLDEAKVSILYQQRRSQPHSPGWAIVPLSLFFLKLSSLLSSFWVRHCVPIPCSVSVGIRFYGLEPAN